MLLTFACVLFGILVLIRPLQRNPFYIINSCMIIGLAYWLEQYHFKTTPFAYKTFLLLIPFQLVTINLTTFVAYYIDKRAAKKGAYRIPEKKFAYVRIARWHFGGNTRAKDFTPQE